MPSRVAAIPAAAPADAQLHFAAHLSHETDCWDVSKSIEERAADFVLLDVRSAIAYARAHIPGAVHLPHDEITAERMAAWPAETLFVVYCTGYFCNGADRAGRKLAMLGRPVKKMIGGWSGWRECGFPVAALETVDA